MQRQRGITDEGVTVTTKDRVRELIEDKGLNVRETATVLGVTTQRVYALLKKLGIDPPSKREEVA